MQKAMVKLGSGDGPLSVRGCTPVRDQGPGGSLPCWPNPSCLLPSFQRSLLACASLVGRARLEALGLCSFPRPPPGMD